MATLAIGRVGLDVTLENPSDWRSTGRNDRVTGYLKGTDVTQRNALRSELLEQVGQMVAVTWSADSTRDGYYIVRDADVRARVENRPFETGGMMQFSVDLERIGSVGSVEHQSLITGAVITNDHGVTLAESEPFHAVPAGAVSYDIAGTPTAVLRSSADGDVPVFIDIDTTDDPSWSVDPGSYYDGGAKISVSSRLRAGMDAPNNPADWELSNGLVRLTPGTTTGVSNGELQMAVYNGAAWDSDILFGVYHAGIKIPEWHYITILRNTPEVCRIRLVRDADEAPPTAYRHVLDIELRRGSMFFSCYYTWSGSGIDMSVRRMTTDAATQITPTGASSAVGIEDAANDTDGNRWCLACPQTHTADTTNGRLTQSSTTTFAFMMGMELDGSSAASGDGSNELMLQYLGHVSERVRAVRR